jgi:hypothetical protein
MPYVARTREQVILKVKAAVETVATLEQVVRRIPSYERLAELQQFASTQFPLAAIEAGLPVPQEKESSRIPAALDLIISELPIKINCYLIDNDDETMDTSISTLLSSMWAALLEDPTFDDYVLSTRVAPNADVEFWHPFVAFQLVVKVKYTHSTGEI